MGFLLGAFGKLAAGQRYRSLQARMMRIQSRLRRATRDAADMEKMINIGPIKIILSGHSIHGMN